MGNISLNVFKKKKQFKQLKTENKEANKNRVQINKQRDNKCTYVHSINMCSSSLASWMNVINNEK